MQLLDQLSVEYYEHVCFIDMCFTAWWQRWHSFAQSFSSKRHDRFSVQKWNQLFIYLEADM